MKRKIPKFLAFLFILVLLAGFFPPKASLAKEIGLKENIESIFTKYSYYLDTKYSDEFKSWFFSAQTYGIEPGTIANTPRHLMSFATFYKYRALGGDEKAREIIEQSIKRSIFWQKINPTRIYSFDGAIANFLIVRLIEQIPGILSKEDIEMYHMFLSYHLPIAIEADDTENRAALAATYWYYVMQYMKGQGIDFDQKLYEKIDQKMQKSIEQTLSKDFLYRENQKQDFSLHYHILEAYLLAIYGDWTKQLNLVIYSREMTRNFRYLSFENGALESSFGFRPDASNAQTYLMAGILSQRFKHNDFQIYLNYLNEGNFFSDPDNPDRLEWHATLIEKEKIYHDDYSFANIAELAMATNNFDQIFWTADIEKTSSNLGQFDYPTFKIINEGNQITFIDKIQKITRNIKLAENRGTLTY